MSMCRRFLLGLSFFFSSTFLLGDCNQPFALLTIPKSGSHMTIKALHFLTGGMPVWHTHFPSLFYIPPKEGFLYTHLCISPQLENNYARLPELKKIINVRDLRDVCVSIVRQICKAPWPGMSQMERQTFKEMSFDEQLMFVINFDYELDEVAQFAPNSLQTSIAKVAEQAVQFSLNEDCLICRYESLVGPQGGGSIEAQRDELLRIAEYLGICVTDSTIDNVAAHIYGNEVDPFGQGSLANFQSTFHKGQVHNWRNYFKEEHKEAFKNKLGSALIALGYEKDNNW